MKEIEIIINEDGTVDIDLIGFHGPECSTVLEELSRAVGKRVQVQKKTEFYGQPSSQKQSNDHRL